MASSIALSSSLPSQDLYCNICKLYLDSLDSFNVHLQYHKENQYFEWGTPNVQNATAQYGNNFSHTECSNFQSEQINWEPKHYSHEYESSSTFYGQPPNQLTPLPSPNQCDKCGFFCESAVQLDEHCRTAHAAGLPNTTEITYQHYDNQYNTAVTHQRETLNVEHEESSAMLYLDSHKDVYQGSDAEPRTSYDKATSQLRDNHHNMFYAEQKFGCAQDIFTPVPSDQKTFSHGDHNLYSGVQVTPKPDCLVPHESQNTPQMTSTQPPTSVLPSIGSKGANWKSNEARRTETYNYYCAACDKWFRSALHLKCHYNTTLHKNAFSSSSSYGSQRFDNGQRSGNLQEKSLYTHLPQGNIESNFSNNPLANQTLQNQVGSHPINIGSQPPGPIYTPTDTGHLAANGGVGPSVTPNHYMRELLSVSTNNTVSPVLTQNTATHTAHPLPSFSHLGVNTNLGTAVASPTPTPQLYMNQNFQKQDTVLSHPNGNAPYVTATLTSSQLTVNPVTSGESTLDGYSIVKQETSPKQTAIRLPSFSQFSLNRSKESVKRNVEGKFIDDKCNKKAIKVLKIERFYNGLRIDDKENFGGQTISTYSPDSTDSNERRVRSDEVIIPGAPLSETNPIKDAESAVSHMCKICSKYFSKSCYLTQHNNTLHSGDKPYKCGRCGKRFRDEISYKNHYKKHTHIKPFKCPECPKSYNHKTDLLRHMCLHSGSKPYSCEECGKGFIRQDHMIKHLETHKTKFMRLAMTTSTGSISSTTTV